MRGRLGDLRSGDALVVVVAVATLVSALWGAKIVLPRMDDTRDDLAVFEPAVREQAIERALGFDHELWRRIRQSVRPGDRYAVISDAPEQHEVRNYAGYELLPAIQVSSREDADVVLYYATAPPAGSECASIRENVCVERRP